SYVANPNFDVVCRIISSTLNNEEVNLDHSTKAIIYPNPAKEYFTIENMDVIDEIKIFDARGKMVYHQNSLNQNLVRINSGTWPDGTYMVQIKSQNRIQLMKVLVK